MGYMGFCIGIVISPHQLEEYIVGKSADGEESLTIWFEI